MHALLAEVSTWGWTPLGNVTCTMNDDGDTLLIADTAGGAVQATFRLAPGAVEIYDPAIDGTVAVTETYLAAVTCRVAMGAGEAYVSLERGLLNIYCDAGHGTERVWFDGHLDQLSQPARTGLHMLCAQLQAHLAPPAPDEPF